MLRMSPLAYLFMHVRDHARAVGFYRDTLGLALAHYVPGVFAFFRTANGVQLGIYPAGDAAEAPSAGSWLMAFEVPDIAAGAQALRDAGVSVSDIQSVPGGRVVFFNDPDGHRLELHQSI